MKSTSSKISGLFHKFFLATSLLALLGCAGTGNPLGSPSNPAAPPAPIAELPSLRYPDSLEINTAPIDAPAPSGKAMKFIAIGDSVAGDIFQISVSTAFLQGTVQRSVLAPLSPLRIPRGVNVTTFEDVILANDRASNIKIDFAAYRFDDSGAGLNCSGNTAQLPICYRIWIDNARTLAGIFFVVPEGDNPGSGQFKGLPIEPVVEGFIGSNYDHANPLAKTTEIFTGQNGFNELGHGVLQEDSVDEVSFTTLNTSFAENEERTRNVAKFSELADYIGLSQESNSPSLENYIGVCGDLMTRTVVDPSLCQGAGVDVTGIPFVDFAQSSDVLPPADFPSSPTFLSSPYHSQ